MSGDARARFLRAHDEELRTEAELGAATHRGRIGPLWLGRFGDRGFVTYRDLAGIEGEELDVLIAAAIEAMAGDPGVSGFEWKTRGHDEPSDLDAHLRRAGLQQQEPETVMIGDAALLSGGAPPRGVSIRRAIDNADVAGVALLHEEAFGPQPAHRVDELRGIVTEADESHQLWVAVVEGRVVSAGRLEIVRGTRFAGLFGGATLAGFRHRGVYRALTAARAAAAIATGAELVYAECTEFSRPILERSGLVAVTTTTPWLWHRGR